MKRQELSDVEKNHFRRQEKEHYYRRNRKLWIKQKVGQGEKNM